MKIYECKPKGEILLQKLFIRNSQKMLSSSDVLVSVLAMRDDVETAEFAGAEWNTDEVMILKEKAVYVEQSGFYEYILRVSDGWRLGAYLVKWEATIGSNAATEWDKVYIVEATREEIVDALSMPSSVNASGISMDFGQKLNNLMSMTGIRVGKMDRYRKGKGQTTFDSKDYKRT